MADGLDFFNKEFDSVNRNDIFYTETHPICSNNFLDFNQALIDVINEKNITLSELSAIQGPVVTFDEVDVNLLDRSDYIDYTKDGENNLKLPFDNELVANTIGTDFYYLSTDSQFNSVSGELFKATNKVNNLLNINHPTTLSISTSSKYLKEIYLIILDLPIFRY